MIVWVKIIYFSFIPTMYFLLLLQIYLSDLRLFCGPRSHIVLCFSFWLHCMALICKVSSNINKQQSSFIKKKKNLNEFQLKM